MTTVADVEPVTVTDLATPPLWHARRVTAGAAAGPAEAAAALRVLGLMPAQLAGESEHLLAIEDFDKARALLDETNEEESMATALDIAPEIDTSPATIRAWAKDERLRVASMGTIPKAIVNAYLAAQGIPLAEQDVIARPSALVTVEPATVTPPPDAVTVEPEPVTVADLREQLDRLGAGYSDAVTKLNAEHAEVERLRHTNEQLQENLRAAEHRLDLPCPGTHCGQEAVCPADAPPKVVSTLPGPLPDEILDLLDAWHQLFAKADDVGTAAGHTLAELATPALVREASDRIHDLIRLLDGDTSR